ncbi:MAG: SHOCT domain-containing protein [Negativicutes bacterium]
MDLEDHWVGWVIPDSLEFLKQRYAKGEMNNEEYRRMKQELE